MHSNVARPCVVVMKKKLTWYKSNNQNISLRKLTFNKQLLDEVFVICRIINVESYLRSNSLRSNERKTFSSYITKKTDKAGDGWIHLQIPTVLFTMQITTL